MDRKSDIQLNVRLWIKGDFLLRCVVPLTPPARLNLKRMIAYAKSKDNLFPLLSYNVWQHIACVKIAMKVEFADMYFRLMLDYLSDKGEKHFVNSSNDLRKTNPSVPLIPFVILLFMQQINRKILRNSMKGPEKYPSESTSESLKSSFGPKENMEMCALDFLKEHLRSLLELIALSSQPSKDHHTPEIIRSSFDQECLSSLDCLLEGDSEKENNVQSFSTLIQPVFSKRNKVDFYVVENILRTKLRNDVYVVAAPTELSDFQPDTRQDFEDQSLNSLNSINSRQKIVHNSKDAPQSHKVVLFSGISKNTVIKSTDAMNHSVSHVYKCQNSHIYLLSPLKLLVVRRCRNTVIFSSPVRNVIRVQYCREVTIIGVCRKLIIANCQECTFYVKTPNKPLILGSSNEKLTFAPFNTSYPELESHMRDVALQALPDAWDQPLCLLNSEANENDSFNNNNDQSLKCCWSLLEPDNFYPFYLPLKFSGSIPKVPGGLPTLYKASMERREKSLKEWNDLVGDVDDKSKLHLQSTMQEKFTAWLKKEGKESELEQLKRLQNAQMKKKKLKL